MLKRLGWALLWAVVAYAAAAIIGMVLVAAFSTNIHDKDLEMGMTGLFFAGPLAGIGGFIHSLAWPRRRGR